jgi:hypothetical protein
MRTVKWNPVLAGVCSFFGGMLLWTGVVSADVTSDRPAAVVVYPLVVSDTSGSPQVDTVIQLTNTAAHPVNVRCFYINANGHCSNNPNTICDTSADSDTVITQCGSDFAFCSPSWTETDFAIRLTSLQPLSWTLSQGFSDLPLSTSPPVGTGEFNSGNIPPASEDPFIGELKCVEVGDDEVPVSANDLKGEATIDTFPGTVADDTAPVDIAGYNAIGIQGEAGDGSEVTTQCEDPAVSCLVLGQDYNPCPAILILDHFFDGATEPSAAASTVRTDLTLVPCSEDLNLQVPASVTTQFLVFNEFEQRFSTSRLVQCFSRLALSDIDTRLGTSDDGTSIFNVNVQGTLVGQTLIRGVTTSSTTSGTGLLGVAVEHHDAYSAAFNLNQRGTRTQNDIIVLPNVQPQQ